MNEDKILKIINDTNTSKEVKEALLKELTKNIRYTRYFMMIFVPLFIAFFLYNWFSFGK